MIVYQFGCLPPSENEQLVRDQIRHAHNYRNQLVEIERARRFALRALQDTEEVRAVIDQVKLAKGAKNKKERRAAMKALAKARKQALAHASDETAKIAERDQVIRRAARAHTKTYWGTYLGIEASHDQVRKMPLWDGLEPNDPSFRSWRGTGQIGVQLQGGLETDLALAGHDRRVNLELGPAANNGRRYGVLCMRVGSLGRDPVWTKVPIKVHREIPDGKWKWVRLSLRVIGRREKWTCEITVDPKPGALPDRTIGHGMVAVELAWDPVDAPKGHTFAVANLRDDRGGRDQIILPHRIVSSIDKASSLRGIRDRILNEMRPAFTKVLEAELPSDVPPWLDQARGIAKWKSFGRIHRLCRRWRDEATDLAPGAYEILHAWVKRDEHLWDYESGTRRRALLSRLDLYRCIAKELAAHYHTVVLDDRDLSREARWGEASDCRFIVAPFELRSCLKYAFGGRVIEIPWKTAEQEASPWLYRALAEARIAQVDDAPRLRGGAWARRKAAKLEKGSVAP